MENAAQNKPQLRIVEKAPVKQLRLLLVDEDSKETHTVRRLFDKMPDARLDFASDTETATRMVDSAHYDLVAVETVLPGGFALLKHIKDNYRWVATLVATRDLSPQNMRRSVKCRIDGLLFKPEPVDMLIEEAMLLARAVNAERQRQQKRILAIGAHPDDVEIGCGGALAKHKRSHDIMHILTLSRGAAGGDTNVRTVEAHRAAALLGARLQLGNLHDTQIGDGPETISLIQNAIREIEPTHVYTHSAEDTHQDHRAVHAASLVAARGVPNLYCYQSPSTTVEFRPHRFVDITDFIALKIEAIAAYGSQTERMDALQEDVIVSTARYWGRYAGYVLAEPMRVIRQRDSDTTLPPRKELPPEPAPVPSKDQ